jgi:upstream activation factor subunit UAF30
MANVEDEAAKEVAAKEEEAAKDEPAEPAAKVEPADEAEGKPAKSSSKLEPASKDEWAKIETRLAAILAAADLTELTTKTVRKQLESEFDCSLGSDASKLWIKEQINAFVAQQDAEEEEEEEAEEEEEELNEGGRRKRKAAPAPKKTAASISREKKAKQEKKEKKEKKEASGEVSDCEEDPRHPPLSDEMAAIVGVQRATRFRLVKLLWRYIKQHDLQDPSDKRYIDCDEKLQKAFAGNARVSAFSMSKFLAPHLLSDEGDEESEEEEEAVKGEGSTKSAAKPAAKRASSKAPTGYTGSADLAEFVGEETNNRFKIVKVMWQYIKANNLQSDPSDKRRIICDATLKKLFNVDEMTAFSIAKHISTHFPPKAEKAVKGVFPKWQPKAV